jgi:hypothetical protein
MLLQDDDRWSFQVEQRTEQLESLTELLGKLEAQQAQIDERKKVQEADVVRRLEAERAEREKLAVGRSSTAMAGRGRVGGVAGSYGNTDGTGGMSILPTQTTGATDVSALLAPTVPEWMPPPAAAAGIQQQHRPIQEYHRHFQNRNPPQDYPYQNNANTAAVTSASSYASREGTSGGNHPDRDRDRDHDGDAYGGGGNDAASTVSALTAE